MDLKSKVFGQLFSRQGEDISGESLASALSVSRAAVWKAINALREEGYAISSATNRGYRLTLCGDETDGRTLSCLLGMEVIHEESLPSTNLYALTLPATTPVLVIADRQSAGRARHGQSFSSPKDGGLYMSYLFFPSSLPRETGALNAYATEVVAAAIGGIAREQEIFKDGKKVGGVLIEVVADQDRIERAAVGIGIYKAGLSGGKQAAILQIIEKLKALNEGEK
jgi:BirA family biotin operon repressor/biotin-[acetyl-CoA-carboxylase] ligase